MTWWQEILLLLVLQGGIIGAISGSVNTFPVYRRKKDLSGRDGGGSESQVAPGLRVSDGTADPSTTPEPPDQKVPDLMAALERSLAKAKTEAAKPRCQMCDYPEDALHHQGQGKGAHTFLGREGLNG